MSRTLNLHINCRSPRKLIQTAAAVKVRPLPNLLPRTERAPASRRPPPGNRAPMTTGVTLLPQISGTKPRLKNMEKPPKATKKPTKNLLKKFKQMTRPESTVIVEAKTGKIGLRDYLHRIGVEPSPKRPCGYRRKWYNIRYWSAFGLPSSGRRSGPRGVKLTYPDY